MKVRCIVNQVDEKLSKDLELGEYAPRMFSKLVPGTEYIVLGITCSPRNEAFGLGPVILVKNEQGGLTFAPLALFDITEPTPSRFWVVKRKGGVLMIWPKSFFEEFYVDDLSEGVPEVVNDFNLMVDAIENENSAAKAPGMPNAYGG